MAEYKFINETVKTKLDELSKKVVLVKDMQDIDLTDFKTAMEQTVKTLQDEVKGVLKVIKTELEVVEGEIKRRGIEKAHAGQLSLFDDKALLN